MNLTRASRAGPNIGNEVAARSTPQATKAQIQGRAAGPRKAARPAGPRRCGVSAKRAAMATVLHDRLATVGPPEAGLTGG